VSGHGTPPPTDESRGTACTSLALEVRSTLQSTTGAGAVQNSRAVPTGNDEFWLGPRHAAADQFSGTARQVLRTVGARAFVQAGESFVEVGLPSAWRQQGCRSEAFSDEWFAMVDNQPELRTVLALGAKVAFRLGAEISFVE
jgi:hypothetical protein